MTLTIRDITGLIAKGESLTVEFKGEKNGKTLSDHEVVEAVVCLANRDGGTLLVGVENDGAVTGAHPRHAGHTDPGKVVAMIFNNTEPPVPVDVSIHSLEGGDVIAIAVPRASNVTATKQGVCVQRILGAHGPECLPYYPHQHASRRAELGLEDTTAMIAPGATLDDLDAVEIARVIDTIRQLQPASPLLGLEQLEMLKALGFVATGISNGAVVPTTIGLLLAGLESSIRKYIPTHSVAFQVLNAQGAVERNDWLYGPLLRIIDDVTSRFDAITKSSGEIAVGSKRILIPMYAPDAIREALHNALLHRDYTRLGTTFIQLHEDRLTFSNPGGFPPGITLQNLLVHESLPRNPRLAEALRRIGIVETTARGIDKIYLGQLRNGRPLPDYSQTDSTGVRLILPGGTGSLAFAELVHEADALKKPFSIDELLALNQLRDARRMTPKELGQLTQKGEAPAQGVAEGLVERGLIEGRGVGKARVYLLSRALYKRFGHPEAFTRLHGFDRAQQEQLILGYLTDHAKITRREAADLCQTVSSSTSNLLRSMVKRGLVVINGTRRTAFYTLPSNEA